MRQVSVLLLVDVLHAGALLINNGSLIGISPLWRCAGGSQNGPIG
jgi:hypothetical protein